MKNRKQTSFRSRYWLLGLSILCVILMLLSWNTSELNGPVKFLASYTVVPMQKGINSIGTLMRDFTDNFSTLEELQKENEDLQARVDALTIENSRLQQETYEIDRLQELYKLDANTSEYAKVGARVISKEAGNWFSTFTIDKGSSDGLAVEMNVISGSGLVGIITEVGPNWSTVQTIINDSSNVSAMVLSTGDNCIVQGDLSTMNDGVIRFGQLINNEKPVEVGEQLVTSHISDKYVQGLAIGTVTEVTTDSNNLTRSGYITPIVDFTQLQEVLVITELKNEVEENENP